MTPLFAITAIRAAIRIGRTAADAFEQYAQERPFLLPDVEQAQLSNAQYVSSVAMDFRAFGELLETDEELKRLWRNGAPTDVPGAEAILLAVAYRYVRRVGNGASAVGPQTPEDIAGGTMVSQWAKGKGPVTPWARVLVAMTDVALEYVGAHPEVFGIGANGEKLVGALAAAVAQAIPDGDTRTALGAKDRFAERLGVLVLHSGLKTISEKPDLVLNEYHLEALLKNVLPPVMAALPDDVTEQVKWRDVTDALLGPALSAAFGTIAEQPTAFLGKHFATDYAAGAVVVGVLRAAQRQDVKARLSHEGVYALFLAAVGVAAKHPALILGELLDEDLTDPAKRSLAEEAAVNMFQSITDTLKAQAPPFDGSLGTAIAVAAIEGLKTSAPALAKSAGGWNNAVGTVIVQVLGGIREALEKKGKSLKDTVFSEAQVTDLARVFVAQVALTPHLVTGEGNRELQRVVANVATAMAADDRLLLTAEDWNKIAGVAAQEAALNAGRLFGINDRSAEGMLASQLIGSLLDAAGRDVARTDGSAGPVLIGETLRDSIIVVLRASAGNVEKAFEARAAIAELAVALNDAAAERGLSMGGKEWSRLFRLLLPNVIVSGEVPTMTGDNIAALLG